MRFESHVQSAVPLCSSKAYTYEFGQLLSAVKYSWSGNGLRVTRYALK